MTADLRLDALAAHLHETFGPDRIATWDDLSDDSRTAWLAHARAAVAALTGEPGDVSPAEVLAMEAEAERFAAAVTANPGAPGTATRVRLPEPDAPQAACLCDALVTCPVHDSTPVAPPPGVWNVEALATHAYVLTASQRAALRQIPWDRSIPVHRCDVSPEDLRSLLRYDLVAHVDGWTLTRPGAGVLAVLDGDRARLVALGFPMPPQAEVPDVPLSARTPAPQALTSDTSRALDKQAGDLPASPVALQLDPATPDPLRFACPVCSAPRGVTCAWLPTPERPEPVAPLDRSTGHPARARLAALLTRDA